MVAEWGRTAFWSFPLGWMLKQWKRIERLTYIVKNSKYLDRVLQNLTDSCDPWQSQRENCGAGKDCSVGKSDILYECVEKEFQFFVCLHGVYRDSFN